MNQTTVMQPSRPRLALRVGITGARELAADKIDSLRQQLTQVLYRVRQEVESLARMTETRHAYHRDANGAVTPELRLLSPLAEGADRLAAEIALELGFGLHVPMPFDRDEYAKDFIGKDPELSWDSGRQSLGAFNHLLTRAELVLELDGARDDSVHDRYDEFRSYEAVGRFVVRNCDLLIAIWDGKPGKGRGGTADIVQFAADFGPPVWWIHADRNQAPIWIVDGRDLRDLKPDPDADHALHTYLRRLIVPPSNVPDRSRHRSLLEYAADLGRRPLAPLAAYFAEMPLQQPGWTTTHGHLMRLASCNYNPPQHKSHPPHDNAVALAWHTAYDTPDKRAAEYAARYRSIYVLVFGLAALALICAAVSLAAGGQSTTTDLIAEDHWHDIKIAATALELGALALILLLVIVNIRHEWHRRSIDYRLLAELCRKQQALAVLGWSLSGRALRTLVEQQGAGEDRATWVVWLFAAMLRATPTPHGVFDHATLERAREIVRHDLVAEQLLYHEGRRELCERAGHSFAVAGDILFLAIIIMVTAKLALLLTNHGLWWSGCLGLAAAIVPALVAASVGVRAYAELEILAGQSRRMRAAMHAGEERIRHMNLNRPLASQELGAEVLEVATLMLQDIDGWVRLFRAKLVEPG